MKATGTVPSDRTIVVERVPDELGDLRICVLTPFGSRVHAPWAMAALRKLRDARAGDIEAVCHGRRDRLPRAGRRGAAARRPPLPLARRDRGHRDARARRLVALRRALPRGRGARAAPAAPARRQAHAALGAAQARGRPARRRAAVPVVPDRPRDVPRVPARRVRSARARRRAARRRVAQDPRHDRRPHDALAVRGVAPLLVRRQLHLRRGRARRRAPRAGAHHRSRAAPRAARRDRAPQAARCRRRRSSTGASSSASTGRSAMRTRSTISCSGSAI